MRILEDEGQKIGQHTTKNDYWKSKGIEVERYPLPCGDYIMANDKTDDVIERKAQRNMKVKKMDFLGAYDIAVDTKKDIQEVISNVCGKQHPRFRDELILARNCGIKLYILIDDDGGYANGKKTIWNNRVTCIDDLYKWMNPRLCLWRNGKQRFPNATKGSTLAKALHTMEETYGCKFLFCPKADAGRMVVEILEGKYE